MIYYYLHQNNSYLLNIQVLIETFLLYFYFYQILSNKVIRKFVSFCSIIFAVIWIISLSTKGIRINFDLNSNLQNISILILTLLYYYEQVVKINTPFIYKEPRFWIVSAYFIYFSGIFFLFIYIPTLTAKDLESNYQITYIFTFIRSILLSIAMIIKPMKDNFRNNFSVTQKNFE